MKHQWPTEVTRAMHEFADAAPVAPSLTSLRQQRPATTSSAPPVAGLDPEKHPAPGKEINLTLTTPTSETNNRRRLLIAAAVVVLGVAGIALVTTHNDGNDQSPAPGATVGVAPTTTVATETVSFAVESANDILVTFTKPVSWGVLDESTVFPSPPTTPAPATSAAPATAPDENLGPPGPPRPIGAYSNLTQDGAVVQFASVANIYSDGCKLDRLHPPVGPTVDDLVTAWANIPHLSPTEPVGITVDGYTGKQIELTVPGFGNRSCGAGHFGFGLWVATVGAVPPSNVVQTENQHFQMLVLDVDGTRLLIAASTDPYTPLQDRAALEQLLASIQIG